MGRTDLTKELDFRYESFRLMFVWLTGLIEPTCGMESVLRERLLIVVVGLECDGFRRDTDCDV
jgi:hypothetical protein